MASEVAQIEDINKLIDEHDEAQSGKKLSDHFLAILVKNGLLTDEKLNLYESKRKKAFELLGMNYPPIIGGGRAEWENLFLDVLHQFFVTPKVIPETDLSESYAFLIIGKNIE